VGSKKKNAHAVALGSMGGEARAKNLSADELSAIGKKGAKARSESLDASRRREISRKAAKTRWAKTKQEER